MKEKNPGIIVILILLFITVFPSGKSFSSEIEFPLVQSFGYFPRVNDRLLDSGRYSLDIYLYNANMFFYYLDNPNIIDLELLSLEFSLKYGLSSRVNLEFNLKGTLLYGGWMDPLIEAFHDIFGLPNANREFWDHHLVNYRYQDLFEIKKAHGYLSSPVLSLLIKLAGKDPFFLKSRFSMGIPLSDRPGLTSGKLFFGAQFITGYRGRKISLKMINKICLLGRPDWLREEELSPLVYSCQLDMQWGRFLAGIIFKTSPLEEIYLGKPGTLMYLGWRISKRLSLFISEDLPPLETTPDLGILLNIKIF